MPDQEEKTILDQIDEMIGEDFSPQEGQEDEVPESTEVEDEVEEEGEPEPDEPTEPSEEEEDASGEEVEEEVPEEGEVEDEEEEEAEEDSGESEEVVDEGGVDEAAELRAQLNLMADAALKQGLKLPDKVLGMIEENIGDEAPVVDEPTVKVQEPAVAQVPPLTSVNDLEIISEGMDFDEFLDNPQNFSQGMRTMLGRFEQLLSQRFVSALPNIINNQVRQITTVQRAAEKFYENNEDLTAVRQFVGAVSNQVVAKHPGWTIDEVLKESAKITRKVLRMPVPKKPKGAKASGKSKVVRPSFAKGGPSKRNAPKPKLSKMQREIDELID